MLALPTLTQRLLSNKEKKKFTCRLVSSTPVKTLQLNACIYITLHSSYYIDSAEKVSTSSASVDISNLCYSSFA